MSFEYPEAVRRRRRDGPRARRTRAEAGRGHDLVRRAVASDHRAGSAATRRRWSRSGSSSSSCSSRSSPRSSSRRARARPRRRQPAARRRRTGSAPTSVGRDHAQPAHLGHAGVDVGRVPGRDPRDAGGAPARARSPATSAGGWAASIMRCMDALFTFPPLTLALAVAALLGASLVNASIAIAIVFVPGLVRLRPRPGARGAGGDVHRGVAIGRRRRSPRMLRKHVLPQRRRRRMIVQLALALRLRDRCRGGPELPRLRGAAADARAGARCCRAAYNVDQRDAVAARAAGAGDAASRSSRSTSSATACATRSAASSFSVAAHERAAHRGRACSRAAAAPDGSATPLLDGRRLRSSSRSRGRSLTVVDDVSFYGGAGRDPRARRGERVAARASRRSR